MKTIFEYTEEIKRNELRVKEVERRIINIKSTSYFNLFLTEQSERQKALKNALKLKRRLLNMRESSIYNLKISIEFYHGELSNQKRIDYAK